MPALLPSLCVLALCTATPSPALPAAPSQEVCDFFLAEKYPDAWEEALARNVPVLILDFDGWDDSEGAMHALLEDKDFLKAAERAVLIVSSQKRYGEKQQIVRGEERTVCGVFGCVPPANHQKMKQAVYADFHEDGTLKTPLFLVAAPDKEPLERLTEEQPPSAVADALVRGQRRMERTGGAKGLGRREYERLVDAHARLVDAVGREDWRRAARAAAEVEDVEGDKLPIHQAVGQAREALENAARKALEDQRARWEAGQARDALFAVDEMAFGLGKHPLGRKAQKQVKDWLRSPEGKAHAAALKEEAAARKLYYEGRDREAAGDFRRALSSLERLRKKHPDTLWAEKAASLIRVCEEELEKKG